jgi:ribosomal protein L37AE/L43A
MKQIHKKLKRFWNWLHLPPKCPKHGRSHLFKHGFEGQWECVKCHQEMLKPQEEPEEEYVAGETWTSKDGKTSSNQHHAHPKNTTCTACPHLKK